MSAYPTECYLCGHEHPHMATWAGTHEIRSLCHENDHSCYEVHSRIGQHQARALHHQRQPEQLLAETPADRVRMSMDWLGEAVAARHRHDWANHIETWLGTVGATPCTPENIIAALRQPQPPFGKAQA